MVHGEVGLLDLLHLPRVVLSETAHLVEEPLGNHEDLQDKNIAKRMKTRKREIDHFKE